MNFNADSFLFHAGFLYDKIFLLINHSGLMFPWTPVSFSSGSFLQERSSSW